MLRRSYDYALANKGYDTWLIQDWLSHKSISLTVRHTALSAARFKDVEF
jgi:type 1 fimbriae regulatory protein FimB